MDEKQCEATNKSNTKPECIEIYTVENGYTIRFGCKKFIAVDISAVVGIVQTYLGSFK